jgi:hypothetical protein
MPIITTAKTDSEARNLYQQAVSRMQSELGWTLDEAHTLLAHLAAGYGVFLHDVAAAVLCAPSLSGGPAAALHQVIFQRRRA